MSKKHKQMIVTVEYVIDDPKIKMNKKSAKVIAMEIENRLHNPELGRYIWTLGTYEDTVVTGITKVTAKV